MNNLSDLTDNATDLRYEQLRMKAIHTRREAEKAQKAWEDYKQRNGG